MLMQTITEIPAFQDNYIWMIKQDAHAVIVDPGDAVPVLAVLRAQGMALDTILITHHHADHTGGVSELMAAFPDARLYCPCGEPKPHENAIYVQDNDEVQVFQETLTFRVITTPGHTRGHIAYFTEGALFCGDTLFAGGCGRLFEGTPKQMYDSLQRLAALEPTTKVFCAHEYTQANLRFCLAVEPDNLDLHQRIEHVNALRAKGLPSVPSMLSEELKTNSFLRTAEKTVQDAVSAHSQTPVLEREHCFAALRQWKDSF